MDERKLLVEFDRTDASYEYKIKKTIGQQNADLQIRKFNNNAQAYYLILGNKEKQSTDPKAYNLNIAKFVTFLEEAKSSFASSK